jgi:hypothetical protein
MIQYSAALVVGPRRRGVLDPAFAGMTSGGCGETADHFFR